MIEKNTTNFWFNKKKLLQWYKLPKKTIISKNNHFYWFPDGKLNVAENCIKKNIDIGLGKKKAIVYIKENGEEKCTTFNDLQILITKFSSIICEAINFKKKNNNILIHGSASLETSVAMLSSANVGICHCVIFEELENDAIIKRIELIKPNILISKTTNLTKIKLFKKLKKKYGYKLIFFDNEFSLDTLVNKKISSNKKKFIHNSNNRLFTLFTSGSTGVPKGIVHSSAGYLLFAKYTCMEKFGLSENSTILCASDAGWINGHTYSLYGPLSIGATSIILEKPILVLNNKKLNTILQKYNVNILYMPVTLIRTLKAFNKKLKIRSKYLKTLGSMGEPLAKNVASWYAAAFNLKKKAIVNTYFQTETGGIICSPKFNDNEKTFGTVGKTLNKFIKLNLKKNLVENDLSIKTIWPGCMIDVINERKVWNKYWNKSGHFNLFDIGSNDKNNNILIHGRNDDVINIRGHRIGSGEIESIIMENDNIAEACVVPIEDEIEGNEIIIFAVINNNNKNLIKNIENKIFNVFGSFALPKEIFFVTALPKTRSGKIMRRLLKNMLSKKNNNIGDTSTMLNKECLAEIRNKILGRVSH